MAKYTVINKTLRGLVGVGSEKLNFNSRGEAVTDSDAVAERIKKLESHGFKLIVNSTKPVDPEPKADSKPAEAPKPVEEPKADSKPAEAPKSLKK